ncbi:GntR family transcriptional regulator [Sporomusa sp.]|uniref:GntR family transcriptional regulator n=1 Tax=Sporomusa sp. TaxID=2078658 RepID=UPI002CD2B853|nr:GntR family transcriptional regulator [Sporomusa sp.]HWR42090.1 GntR family transcriptional regulator [Sporomusa sp.]
MNLSRLDNSNLLDKTYELMKDLIVRRVFKPNQKISIPELASQLGVSRTPIRDALNRLEKDGLVKTVPKVGTFVNAIEVDDILDIMDTRLMLELWVLEKLKALSAEEFLLRVKDLENILGEASALIEQSPLETYLKSDYNLQFHLEFIKLGGNKRNVEIYSGLMNYHYLAVEHALITKEMVISAISQHYSIVNTIKHRDFANAETSIRLHLKDSIDRLMRQLAASGGQI